MEKLKSIFHVFLNCLSFNGATVPTLGDIIFYDIEFDVFQQI